jgi:MbtH protein
VGVQEDRLADDLSVDGKIFVVLINTEGQYSLWPSGQVVPTGWSRVGPMGRKEDCLAFVEANWVDMRPSSLRESMEPEKHDGAVKR